MSLGTLSAIVAGVILFAFLVNKGRDDDDDNDGPTAWAVA